MILVFFSASRRVWQSRGLGALGLDALREAYPVSATMKTVDLLRSWCKGTAQVKLALGCGSHFIGVVPVVQGFAFIMVCFIGVFCFHMYCERALSLFLSK